MSSVTRTRDRTTTTSKTAMNTANTTKTPTRATSAAAQPRWSEVESRLWVAELDGDLVGTVEFYDGHFVTCNGRGVELGSSSSLPAAQAALLTARAHPVPLAYVAAVAGTVVLSLSTMTVAALSW